MTGSAEELVDIVDENDQVVDVVTRAVMRRDVLRHRCVFIVVIDGANEILVHRRSLDKDVWPGWWDLAVGGVVTSGEGFAAAARRELAEEIGVHLDESLPLEIFDDGRVQPYEDEDVSLLGRCYVLRHDGPFQFADGEVVEARWVSLAELESMMGSESFLPDSRALLLDRLRTYVS